MSFTLIGGNSGIVINNSYGIELYIKGGTDYYRLTCLYKPKSADYSTSKKYTAESVDTINLFEFILTPKAGEPGAAFYPSELSYAELFTNDSDTEFTGSEIYIKKGSPLHYYLETNGYDKYINTKTPYLYFGKLYPKNAEDNTIQIETYFMKDYVLNALPEANRTENLREFFGVAFDQLYSQVYNKMRNILRLSDPYETKEEYLHYLLETYGTTSILPSGSVNYDAERFFVKNLSSLLKRKGTYEALVVLFRLITHTINRLNVYEQWHEPLPLAAPSPYDSIETYCTSAGYDWFECPYVNYYSNPPSASTVIERYYDTGYPTWSTTPTSAAPPGSLLLSPHYRVELDLSTQPIGNGNIINEEMYNVLVEKFEQVRPVARYSTYSEVVGLLSDFTDMYSDTYDGKYAEHLKTKCTKPVYGTISGNYIFANRSTTETEIGIVHNLGTKDLLVQLYTMTEDGTRFERIIPSNITITSINSIIVSLSIPTQFYAFIASVKDPPDDSNEIDVFPLDPDTGSSDAMPIVDIWKQQTSNKYRYAMYPASHFFTAGSPHNVGIPTIEAGMTYHEISLRGSYIYTVNGSLSHTITHNLGTQGLIVEIFKITGTTFTKVSPIDIFLVDLNNIEVNVADYDTYSIIIRKVTNWPYFDTIGDVMYFLSYLKLGEGTSTSTYNPMTTSAGELQDEIDSSYYTVRSFDKYYATGEYSTYNIKVVIDINRNINITEAGLFNTSDELVYYTTCSPIFAAEGTRLTFYYTLEGDTL